MTFDLGLSYRPICAYQTGLHRIGLFQRNTKGDTLRIIPALEEFYIYKGS